MLPNQLLHFFKKYYGSNTAAISVFYRKIFSFSQLIFFSVDSPIRIKHNNVWKKISKTLFGSSEHVELVWQPNQKKG